ncbi:MAG: ATP-binding protein [Verrucomicrobiota bacterium]
MVAPTETTTKPRAGKTDLPVSDKDQKKAASAHAGINIPLNVKCWESLEPEIQDQLIWFHQHIIDKNLSWKQIEAEVGYDSSTLFRVLKGTYEGSYKNVIKEIIKYRERMKIVRRSTFAENRISSLIFSTLDYASTCFGMVMIMGESGQGKSICAEEWMHRNNGGRTALVEVPPTGGHKGFLRAFAGKQKSNKRTDVSAMEASTLRAFNSRRVLLIDEAHRLIPTDRRTNPYSLEFLRYLHDTTGVPVGILTTQRFNDQLKKNQYMFEQVLGRIDLTVSLPEEMGPKDFRPIVEQYIKEPSENLDSLCLEIVNNWDGRLRRLDKLFTFASRIASKNKETLAEKHVFQAVAWRKKLEKGEI